MTANRHPASSSCTPIALIAMLLGACCITVVSAAPAHAPRTMPAPAKDAVDFARDIKPILAKACVECHGLGKKKGGFSIATRASLLHGGDSGPAVVIGDSGKSDLITLVLGNDPDTAMPQKGELLSLEQVALLRGWIDQGVPWEEGFNFDAKPQAPLALREVKLPAVDTASELTNPIDRLLAPYLKEHDVAMSQPVPDHVFARRVYLDLIGLLPSPQQLAQFESDARPDKRARLVEQVLADHRGYAEHWLTFWNDLLRNAYRGTGFIDDGRKQITPWLYRSLYDNKPYDRFVHELISAAPGAEGFVRGIKWRGTVNDSQRREMQAAQTISQVFLGTNLKCASCHDSFVNHWKLDEAYALASVFAEKPLEIHRCDKPTGQLSRVDFIYPQLGTIDASAPVAQRMEQLAGLVVKPQNGRLRRTMVNRLWAATMGRGIVEPLDDMDAPPWHGDLLDYLAADFAAHGHDVRHTLMLICTSRAYQLPSVGQGEPASQGEFVFRGPLIKRFSAEQFVDAVASVTQAWPQATGLMRKADGRGQGGQLAAALAVLRASAAPAAAPGGAAPLQATSGGKWIWSHADAARADEGGRIYLRRVVKLDSRPQRAAIIITCDNQFALYVNGHRVAESSEWSRPVSAEVTELLVAGDNVFAVEATNWPDRENNVGVQVTGANPAGLRVFAAAWRDGKPVWQMHSDADWRWSKSAATDWHRRAFDDAAWKPAVELAGGLPWKIEEQFVLGGAGGAGVAGGAGIAAAGEGRSIDHIRSALTIDDELSRALGRPNREQVVTRRDSQATTLQALELSNGATLDALLNQGADNWLKRGEPTSAALVDAIFAQALGRSPTETERAIARELIGEKPTREGVADLLWVVFMLPEFQLIR